ncbi:MAG: sulfite exporter TauE/SafE family protein [Flavisolibacter sp.]|nr:sulfite exporter TauE/SafE family protein [Flavisolibacter sp.]
MFVGYFVISYIPFNDIWLSVKGLPQHIDNKFYWMIAAGFLAQLVDGALGMGYGVTCTTILLSLGVNLPAISGSIHTAEMFSSGASGYSHYKFGNVNKKLFKALLIPGIIGAIIGAFLLSKLGDKHAVYIRPLLAAYTMFLGIRILSQAFSKQKRNRKVKRVGWLAWAGGFLDSFGGGGWGPLVTSTLISKGRTPKYVIGSVSITEFFVTLASALTFFSMLGISHWQVIMGLIIGGVTAAPLAARLAGKLPLKTMFICVGAMVIIWSLRILWKVLY